MGDRLHSQPKLICALTRVFRRRSLTLIADCFLRQLPEFELSGCGTGGKDIHLVNRFRALISTVAVGMLVMASGAGAATFDFEAEGNATEAAYTSFVRTDDGIQVTATGRSLSGTPYWAYLDGGNAGLGVCQSNTNSCGSDDSVTYNEVVQLAFDQLVEVTSITFRDGGHGTTFSGLAGFAIDGFGGVNSVDDFSGFDPNSPLALLFQPLTSLQIIAGGTFQSNDSVSNDLELYISSITVRAVGDIPDVPEPATLGLFGLGLLALRIRVRRKRS